MNNPVARWLVDTTVLIDFTRGRKEAVDFLSQEQGWVVSRISVGELWQGARDKRELRLLKQFVNHVQVVELNPKTGKKAVELVGEYCLGQGMYLLDALIAAVALEQGLVLVTDNVKHFRFVEGLVVKSLEEVSLEECGGVEGM